MLGLTGLLLEYRQHKVPSLFLMVRRLFVGQVDLGIRALAAGNGENDVLVGLCVDVPFHRESPLLVLEALLLLLVLAKLRAAYNATCK